MMDIIEKLRNVVSTAHASDSPYIRYAYSKNVNPLLQGIPEYVVQPSSAEEISEILKIANQDHIPVYPRGGGCCEFGGSKPIGDGGIVIDMKRMDKLIELDAQGLVVTVDAGMSWAQLDEHLRPYGLYSGCMGPGSGMTASIGGGISHHSVGGGGCAKFGACTKQLIGLEVVLPTGEIISTGSKANRYTQKAFGRYGNGPDFAGMFSGDNGILGIKTKVTLQVFPRPKFWDYKTYVLKGDTAKSAATIMQEIRHQAIDVYDAMYLPDVCVAAFRSFDVFKPWKENRKANKGMFFYAIEGQTENELKEKGTRLDKIFEDQRSLLLGPEISDGNIAKWHITEQGHWQLYHSLWGVDKTSEPCTAECFVSIESFPTLLEIMDKWDQEHTAEIDQIAAVSTSRPIIGSGPVLLLGENNVEVTCGFTTFFTKEVADINMKLWKSLIKLVTQFGAQWYMMGDFCSREFVEVGAYSPEYLALLNSIKRTVDPNYILSRGKFKLGDDLVQQVEVQK